jgi:hypothetical protein
MIIKFVTSRGDELNNNGSGASSSGKHFSSVNSFHFQSIRKFHSRAKISIANHHENFHNQKCPKTYSFVIPNKEKLFILKRNSLCDVATTFFETIFLKFPQLSQFFTVNFNKTRRQHFKFCKTMRFKFNFLGASTNFDLFLEEFFTE